MTPSLIHRLRLASWTVAVSALALLTLTLLFSSPSESRVADVLHLMALVLLLAAIAIRSFLIARSAPPRTAVPYGFVASIRGLLTRLLVALGLNLLYWVAVAEPHYPASTPYWFARFVALIDLPVAAVGLLLPSLRAEAVDVYCQSFSYGTTRFCFGVPPFLVWSHLLLALPVWLFILYLPFLSRALGARVNTHSGA